MVVVLGLSVSHDRSDRFCFFAAFVNFVSLGLDGATCVS